jgi:hypothetical protein
MLCSVLCSYAQKRPGKIITLKGDTVTGKIYDWNHVINPDTIVFIRDKDKKIELLTPEKISAAILEGSAYFVSAKVKVDMFYSTRRKPLETYVRADKAVIRHLFMRALLIDKLNLYVYADENGKEHFFTKAEGEDYKELLFKKAPVKVGAEQHVVEESRFHEQLKSLMNDCSSLYNKIDFLHYTEKDLMKLFIKYNDCTFNEPDYVSRLEKNRVSLHILAGADIAQFSFTGRDYFSHFEDANFPVSLTFLPGARFIIPLQKKQKKLSIVTDFTNRNISMSSYYQHSTVSDTYIYDVHVYMDYVKWNTGFRYKLRTQSVEPYFNGGFAFNYLVDFISSKEQTSIDKDGEAITTHGVAMQEPHPFDIGFFAGIGLHYKRLNLDGRYEQSTGFSPIYNLDSHVATIDVILSFRLSREE